MPEPPLAYLLWSTGPNTRRFAETVSKLGKANSQEMREALDAIVHAEVREAWRTLDAQMREGVNVAVYNTDSNPEISTAYFLAGLFGNLRRELGLGSPSQCLLFRNDNYPHGLYNIFVAAVRVVHHDYSPVGSSIGEIRFEKVKTAAAATPTPQPLNL